MIDRIREGAVTLVLLTLLGAGSFALGPYFGMCSSSHRTRSRSVDEVTDDDGAHLVKRAALGGGVGLALALFVLVRGKEDDDA